MIRSGTKENQGDELKAAAAMAEHLANTMGGIQAGANFPRCCSPLHRNRRKEPARAVTPIRKVLRIADFFTMLATLR